MPEKFEQQFFRPERAPEGSAASEIAPPGAPEVKGEPKTEKAITLENRAGMVKNFLEKEDFLEERKEFLSKLQPLEMEKIIGQKELNLIYNNISAADAIRKEITKHGLIEEEIRQFRAEKREVFLPERLRCAMASLKTSDSLLFRVLNVSAMLGMEKREPASETAEIVHRFPGRSEQLKKEQVTNIKDLRQNLKLLKEELSEWQACTTFERQKEEKPMKVKGFEALFGYPRKKSEEIVKIAAEILPRGLFSTNIKSIEYQNIIKPIKKEDFGFDGESAAVFDRDKIIFYRTEKQTKADVLKSLPFSLAHEWGHSIDPRSAGQKDLHPVEQFRMIKEWEEVRSEEAEWSSYVARISNPDPELEDLYKSRESLADSIAYFLNNPEDFARRSPKRHEFCVKWLQKRFPELSFKGRFQRERFVILPDGYLIEGRIKEKK